MIEYLYDTVKQLFQLTELDVGEFTRIKSRGMNFHVRLFDAKMGVGYF